MRASTLSMVRIHFPLVVLLTALACTKTEGTNSAAKTDTPAAAAEPIRTGSEADDWTNAAPGVRYHINAANLPAPAMTGTDPEASVAKFAEVVAAPEGAALKVPDGFEVSVFATGFKQPRRLRTAPNGDVFLSESGSGRVLVFQGSATGAAASQPHVFAEGLDRPYGIAFLPPANPQYVYVAAANQVVRYPYRSGDLKATGPAKVIVPNLPTKRHWTKDLAVSQDGQRLFLSIGSASNLGIGMSEMTPAKIQEFEATHGRGAAWGEEENRAVVRVFDPAGKTVRNYATGMRNCSGLAMQPGTDNLWCVVNERDHLGPYLQPDYMVHVQDSAFYGWPWYTIGDTEDPARKGQRPDLKGQARVPEVLIQAHSSSLGIAFYDRDAFPAEYRGDAFVALHGSHSRPQMTGYKVIRVRMTNGKPTGEYEDFITGFVLDNAKVWGRPAGLAVTQDGALLVSDDANGTIFRVTRK